MATVSCIKPHTQVYVRRRKRKFTPLHYNNSSPSTFKAATDDHEGNGHVVLELVVHQLGFSRLPLRLVFRLQSLSKYWHRSLRDPLFKFYPKPQFNEETVEHWFVMREVCHLFDSFSAFSPKELDSCGKCGFYAFSDKEGPDPHVFKLPNFPTDNHELYKLIKKGTKMTRLNVEDCSLLSWKTSGNLVFVLFGNTKRIGDYIKYECTVVVFNWSSTYVKMLPSCKLFYNYRPSMTIAFNGQDKGCFYVMISDGPSHVSEFYNSATDSWRFTFHFSLLPNITKDFSKVLQSDFLFYQNEASGNYRMLGYNVGENTWSQIDIEETTLPKDHLLVFSKYNDRLLSIVPIVEQSRNCYGELKVFELQCLAGFKANWVEVSSYGFSHLNLYVYLFRPSGFADGQLFYCSFLQTSPHSSGERFGPQLVYDMIQNRWHTLSSKFLATGIIRPHQMEWSGMVN